jgi:hypothetical protein
VRSSKHCFFETLLLEVVLPGYLTTSRQEDDRYFPRIPLFPSLMAYADVPNVAEHLEHWCDASTPNGRGPHSITTAHLSFRVGSLFPKIYRVE